jgi:hypothetical protein
VSIHAEVSTPDTGGGAHDDPLGLTSLGWEEEQLEVIDESEETANGLGVDVHSGLLD